MRFISWKSRNFVKMTSSLYDRQSYPPEIESGVKSMIDKVRKDGDSAICVFAEKIDGVSLTPSRFRVCRDEIEDASAKVSPAMKSSIKYAIKNITDFARKRIPSQWSFTPRPGVILGERFEPYESVGVYIPGGSAPLVSTAVHTISIAKAAGVKNIVAVTPPGKKGSLPPELIYAMDKAGATEIFRLGGVYAIAALAYGTKTVRKVEKIVGPGNAYVTAAKKLVFGNVAIDMVAGPSEIMVIADSGQNPEFIAADLLSQAEHGSGLEQAVMVSTDHELIKRTAECVKIQAKSLSRGEALNKVIKNGMFFIEVENLEQAVDVANRYAPEHLEIICENAKELANGIKAAGAIFLGEWTPECVGDFTAGPSHVLPTGGAAKYFSGLRIEDFFRRMSIINYQRNSLEEDLPSIMRFAAAEGLDAHGRSALLRCKTPLKR